MNVNPFQLIQMLKGGSNPQQLLMNILQQRGRNNPIIQNASNLAQNGNISALQTLARNLAVQRGLDYDKQLANLKSYFK